MMSKRRDDEKPNTRYDAPKPEDFSLDDILAEFGSHRAAPEPPKPAKRGLDDTIPFPVDAVRAAALAGGVHADWREDTIPFPVSAVLPPPEEDDDEPEEEDPAPSAREEPDGPPEGVLSFPGEEPPAPSPLSGRFEKLRRKADEFASHMYEEEGVEEDEEVLRAEQYIPGVDAEEEAAPPERPKRRVLPPAPDLSPAELTKRYGRGLKLMRARAILLFLLLFPLTYLTLMGSGVDLPMIPGVPWSDTLLCYSMAAVQAAAMLLSGDVMVSALCKPFTFRMGMDTLAALAAVATLADALTLPLLYNGTLPRCPLSLVSCAALLITLEGSRKKRWGQRTACRTAAAASEPYLVTRDEGKWNGRDTYAKWSGNTAGFGSQMQGADGAERIYRLACPLLLLGCLFCSLISSLGHDRPGDLIWCLSATLSACAALGGSLCFALPWRRLAIRLSKSGAALAGWEGVTNTTGTSGILLTDADLFPPGAVKLNGVKIFGDFSVEKVVSCAATVVRDAGGGLDRVFHDLLRSQGGLYRRGSDFTAHEGGGASELVQNQQVRVGSASFMTLMEVALPQGLNVKNAVFCAIDGELAGIFALKYRLLDMVSLSLDALIRNRVRPVLATRDFNIIPNMLRQRFKLPADKMEFPPIERRRELSDEEQEHSETLTAVLCREGLGPYAEAVIGGKRLRLAVRLSAGLCCLGAVVGLLLTFYLTFVSAYDSLTPLNLLVFLVMWLIPVPLISGWVDRY